MMRVRPGTIAEVVDLALRIPEFDDPHGLRSNCGSVKVRLQHIVVVEVDGTAAGFRACKKTGLDSCAVWMAAVLPEARGRGAYVALFDAQNAALRREGIKFLRTTVREENDTMRRILAKRRFRVMDKLFDERTRSYKLLMELEL